MEMSARAAAIFARTYSRPLEGGGHETFEQAIDRVVRHQRRLWGRALKQDGKYDGEDFTLWEGEAELEDLRQLMLDRKVLPSGRILWLGGTEISLTRELAQFACSGHLIKTVHDVVDAAWLLLNGCGIGPKPQSGVLNGFAIPITDIEVIRSTRTEKGGEEFNTETFIDGVWTIRVGDSGEAWAKAIGKIVAGKYRARKLVLDFSQIRPEGSLLSRYGWRSSGDVELANELPKICAILSRRADQLLTKLDILNIINHLGVIQTGRRGAEIGLMDEGDPEIEAFQRFKTGCYSDPALKHRQSSNNSILFWEKPTRTRLEDIFTTIIASGGSEPGFINASAARYRAPWFATVNPCVEILLADKGFCNLFETDVSKFTNLGELCEALRIVARANYRQTLVNLDDGILQRTWHEVNEHLRLCGVSITGVVGRPDLTPHDYRTMRIAAQAGAWSMADELGTPRPKNVTCVKPSGTLGKVMDAPGEGAHKPLGRYVMNSIVYDRSDPLVPALKAGGYEVRPHPTAETQVLVKFPVENTGVVFEDFNGTPVNLEPAIDQLNRYKMLMDHWCDQNVSLTVYYDKDEAPAIIDWFMQHWDSYVGVSFAYRTDPTKTAADFNAAYLPQEVVDKVTFDEYVARLGAVDLTDVGGALDLNDMDSEECEGGVCPIR